jgi:hypothetical protein
VHRTIANHTSWVRNQLTEHTNGFTGDIKFTKIPLPANTLYIFYVLETCMYHFRRLGSHLKDYTVTCQSSRSEGCNSGLIVTTYKIYYVHLLSQTFKRACNSQKLNNVGLMSDI